MATVVIALLWLACAGDSPTAVTAPPPSAPTEQVSRARPDSGTVLGQTDLSTATRSCPEGMLPVPGGRFVMGDDGAESGRDEGPVHVVRVDPFCMDRTEATLPGEATPMVGVTFEAAQAACSSRGGRLPTEAEWEKAARGGCELAGDPLVCTREDQRQYPWGDESPTCTLANHSVVGPGGPKRCQAGPARADGIPAGAGPYGHLNLAGNVWEYVMDFYHPSLYRSDRPDNPSGPPSGPSRVLRGGAWDTFSTNMRVSNRFTDGLKGSTVGFRCVSGGGTPVPESIEPVQLVEMPVVVRMADGSPVQGRWLAVTAFDSGDIDPRSGLPAPGRSPVAETGVEPSGAKDQVVTIRVPGAIPLRFSAALDNGSAPKGMPSAASGGIAWAPADRVATSGGDALSLELAPMRVGRPHSPRP